MAEPPAVDPARAAAPGRVVLLATKLHVPGPRPGFVPRPRLTGALSGGLVLVCAPAGFGKTALLADWLRSGGRPAAWLSLDAGDNDPVRFWRHVVAALDRARPGIGALLGPSSSSCDRLVTALINELAAQPGESEIVLVLDDYHLVDAQEVHASMAFLLEHRPPGLHLVLASRSDPPLPLARLRAAGSFRNCAPPTCGSPPGRQRPCCARRPGPSCPTPTWRRWRRAPKAGRRACSWPPCPCGADPTWPGSWPTSAAATATSWTT